jgi:hypothetical protein
MVKIIEMVKLKFSSQHKTKLFLFITGLSFLFSLMNLFKPLDGDELEYRELAESLLKNGRYFVYGQPSTFSPLVPFLISFFYLKSMPAIGFALAKLANWIFVLAGMYFANKTLKFLNIDKAIRYSILMLTITNTHIILWSSSLLPDPLIFGFFWMFLFFVARSLLNPASINYFYLLLVFSLLVMGRYVYAVYGVFVLWVLWEDAKINKALFWDKKLFTRRLVMGVLGCIPLLLWARYVSSVEMNQTLESTYFSRFYDFNFFERIKIGLGLRDQGNGRVNGIPAIISLFIPKTGFREWITSLAILLIVLTGLFFGHAKKVDNLLRFALLLLLLGLVFAATGFSRYWMPLLPIFWLGMYYFYRKFKLDNKYFVYFGLLFIMLYLANAARLNLQFYLSLLN